MSMYIHTIAVSFLFILVNSGVSWTLDLTNFVKYVFYLFCTYTFLELALLLKSCYLEFLSLC